MSTDLIFGLAMASLGLGSMGAGWLLQHIQQPNER